MQKHFSKRWSNFSKGFTWKLYHVQNNVHVVSHKQVISLKVVCQKGFQCSCKSMSATDYGFQRTVFFLSNPPPPQKKKGGGAGGGVLLDRLVRSQQVSILPYYSLKCNLDISLATGKCAVKCQCLTFKGLSWSIPLHTHCTHVTSLLMT